MPVALVILILWATSGNAQSRFPPAGVELRLTVERFPGFTIDRHFPTGIFPQRHDRMGMLGASLAVFPIRYLGVRASGATTGPSFYSEDISSNRWLLAVEGRGPRLGPVTPVASIGFGRFSNTYGLFFRYWTAGLGARLPLFGPITAAVDAELIRGTSSGIKGSGVLRTVLHLDPLVWRVGLAWRLVRFGGAG
jgi:hypothetical protein